MIIWIDICYAQYEYVFIYVYIIIYDNEHYHITVHTSVARIMIFKVIAQ